MESLTLTIESHADDDLETEATFSSTGTSIKVGRKAGNDWVLPDQTRHISSNHFDILWEEDGYYLHDLSTNGTFINGAKDRVDGPHHLADGDRIQVGVYVIHARLREVAPPTPPVEIPAEDPTQPPQNMPAAPPKTAQHRQAVQAPPGAAFLNKDAKSNVQSPGHSHLAKGQAAQTPDFARFQTGVPNQSGVSAPPVTPSAPPIEDVSDPFEAILSSAISDDASAADVPVEQPAQAPFEAAPDEPLQPEKAIADFLIPDDDFTLDLPKPNFDLTPEPKAETFTEKAEFSSELSQAPRGMGETFGAADRFSPFSEDDLPVKPRDVAPVVAPAAAPIAPKPQPVPAPVPQEFQEAPKVAQTDAQPPAPAATNDDFLKGFLEGAGIDSAEPLEIPLRELGRILGECARLGTREMMQMLQDRSAVKLFVAQEDRTMRISSGNNPMKFMLDPDEAFDALFVVPRSGYQTGADGFENALTDIRKHQSAMMAAVQPAMADILSGLAPSDIESATGGSGGGVLGGGARKCWDEYNKRWKTRANQGENGMLDAFIDAFAKRYSEALDNL